MAERAARKLGTTQDGAPPPANPAVSDALMEVIESLGTELLRKELKFLCQELPAVVRVLGNRLLVQGKDVVRYHANTDSEEGEGGGMASDESESGSDRESSKRKPIVIGDKQYTARMAMCENCEKEFDVTTNYRGAWEKDVDDNPEFWAYHLVNGSGPCEARANDPDFAEGYAWDCCGEPGDGEGCKSTKHRAKSNLLVITQAPRGGRNARGGKLKASSVGM
ncbi:MAG: hypothetical protein M1813_006446 [Trichoglossum hirsutum]|nr:MAG: hypothetical protein M1813_007458 [Trichoglossum hirsutum]KAI9859903.1 MAG: hypothetical protein M1813_006446 [Trichoglossum hirsutum]